MQAPAAACQPEVSLIRVIIIGAGTAGLATCRAALQLGFKVTLLDEGKDLGGSWASCSPEALLQVPWWQYAFPDFPWPARLQPEGETATAAHVQAYLHAYARHFGLMPFIRLQCRLVRLTEADPHTSRVSASASAGNTRWHAVVWDMAARKHIQMSASYVVLAVGLCSQPYTPNYPGQASFLGQQVHARHLLPRIDLEGKDVLIVGGSFSVWDQMAEEAVAEAANSVTLLYRRVHWPMPAAEVGCDVGRPDGGVHQPVWEASAAGTPDSTGAWLSATTDNVQQPHALPCDPSALQAAPYYTAQSSWWARTIHAWLQPVRALAATAAERYLRQLYKMDQAALQPSQPLLADLMHGINMLGSHQPWAPAARHPHLDVLEGRVRCFTPEGIVMDSGVEVPADVVIYTTGFMQTFNLLDTKVLVKLRVNDDGLYLYRSMVHPDVPHLAFIGCGADTTNGLHTAALQSRWLAAFMLNKIPLPGVKAMKDDMKAQAKWRRAHMPPSHNRAARYGLYTAQYHQQLVSDLKGKVAHPLSLSFGACCWSPGPARSHRLFAPPSYIRRASSVAGSNSGKSRALRGLGRISCGSVMELDDHTLQNMRIPMDTSLDISHVDRLTGLTVRVQSPISGNTSIDLGPFHSQSFTSGPLSLEGGRPSAAEVSNAKGALSGQSPTPVILSDSGAGSRDLVSAINTVCGSQAGVGHFPMPTVDEANADDANTATGSNFMVTEGDNVQTSAMDTAEFFKDMHFPVSSGPGRSEHRASFLSRAAQAVASVFNPASRHGLTTPSAAVRRDGDLADRLRISRTFIQETPDDDLEWHSGPNLPECTPRVRSASLITTDPRFASLPSVHQVRPSSQSFTAGEMRPRRRQLHLSRLAGNTTRIGSEGSRSSAGSALEAGRALHSCSSFTHSALARHATLTAGLMAVGIHPSTSATQLDHPDSIAHEAAPRRPRSMSRSISNMNWRLDHSTDSSSSSSAASHPRRGGARVRKGGAANSVHFSPGVVVGPRSADSATALTDSDLTPPLPFRPSRLSQPGQSLFNLHSPPRASAPSGPACQPVPISPFPRHTMHSLPRRNSPPMANTNFPDHAPPLWESERLLQSAPSFTAGMHPGGSGLLGEHPHPQGDPTPSCPPPEAARAAQHPGVTLQPLAPPRISQVIHLEGKLGRSASGSAVSSSVNSFPTPIMFSALVRWSPEVVGGEEEPGNRVSRDSHVSSTAVPLALSPYRQYQAIQAAQAVADRTRQDQAPPADDAHRISMGEDQEGLSQMHQKQNLGEQRRHSLGVPSMGAVGVQTRGTTEAAWTLRPAEPGQARWLRDQGGNTGEAGAWSVAPPEPVTEQQLENPGSGIDEESEAWSLPHARTLRRSTSSPELAGKPVTESSEPAASQGVGQSWNGPQKTQHEQPPAQDTQYFDEEQQLQVDVALASQARPSHRQLLDLVNEPESRPHRHSGSFVHSPVPTPAMRRRSATTFAGGSIPGGDSLIEAAVTESNSHYTDLLASTLHTPFSPGHPATHPPQHLIPLACNHPSVSLPPLHPSPSFPSRGSHTQLPTPTLTTAYSPFYALPSHTLASGSPDPSVSSSLEGAGGGVRFSGMGESAQSQAGSNLLLNEPAAWTCSLPKSLPSARLRLEMRKSVEAAAYHARVAQNATKSDGSAQLISSQEQELLASSFSQHSTSCTSPIAASPNTVDEQGASLNFMDDHTQQQMRRALQRQSFSSRHLTAASPAVSDVGGPVSPDSARVVVSDSHAVVGFVTPLLLGGGEAQVTRQSYAQGVTLGVPQGAALGGTQGSVKKAVKRTVTSQPGMSAALVLDRFNEIITMSGDASLMGLRAPNSCGRVNSAIMARSSTDGTHGMTSRLASVLQLRGGRHEKTAGRDRGADAEYQITERHSAGQREGTAAANPLRPASMARLLPLGGGAWGNSDSSWEKRGSGSSRQSLSASTASFQASNTTPLAAPPGRHTQTTVLQALAQVQVPGQSQSRAASKPKSHADLHRASLGNGPPSWPHPVGSSGHTAAAARASPFITGSFVASSGGKRASLSHCVAPIMGWRRSEQFEQSHSSHLSRPMVPHMDAAAANLLDVSADVARTGQHDYAGRCYAALLRDMAMGLDGGGTM